MINTDLLLNRMSMGTTPIRNLMRRLIKRHVITGSVRRG